MSRVEARACGPVRWGDVPEELARLADRVRGLPADIRVRLEPAVDDAVEEAVFRGRVLVLAKQALERFRTDLDMIRFDLEATRREREGYRMALEEFAAD